MQSTISLRGLFARGQFALYTAVAEKAAYFAVFVCLARISSVANYGIITAVFAFANILAAFFELGLAPYFQREAAAQRPDLERKLHSALGIRILLLLPFFGIAYLYFAGTGRSILVFLIVLIVSLGSVGGIFSRLLYGQNKYAAAFKALVISKAGVVLAVVICFLLKTPPEYVLAVLFGGILLQVLLMMAEVRSAHISIRAAFFSGTLRSMLASSIPMGIGLSFVWIYDKADILLIRKFLGSESVSYYAVAYSLYKIPQLASGALLLPFFTDASARFAASNTLRIQDLAKPAVVLIAISIGAMLIYNAVPAGLLVLVYGQSYGTSANILAGLSFALPALLLNNLTGVTLNAVKHERIPMTSAACAFAVNIVANIVLLPVWGIGGAVAATIITEYFVLLIQSLFLFRTRDITW
jgi:O-antigen/teichoic acid export membrane protein